MRGNFQIMIGVQDVTEDAVQYQVVRRLSHPSKFWVYLPDVIQGNNGYFGTINSGDEITFSTQQRTDVALVDRFFGYVDRVKCLTDGLLNFVEVEGRDALGFWNDIIVREHYTDTPLNNIVADLVATYDPLSTATSIQDPGFTIGYIQFPFMPLFDCIDFLASIVGWSFRIDEAGIFKFFNPQDPAQAQNTWTVTTDMGTAVESTPPASNMLRIRRATNKCERLRDRGLKRKVILGAGFVEKQTDIFKGDGATKVFPLSKSPMIFRTSGGVTNDDPYSGIALDPSHGPVVTLGGVSQNVGTEGVDRSFDANNLNTFQGEYDSTIIDNTPITDAKAFASGTNAMIDPESQTVEFTTAPGNGVSGTAVYKHFDPAIIDKGMTTYTNPNPTVEQIQFVPPIDTGTATRLAQTELMTCSGDHFHTECETINEDMAKPGDQADLDIDQQFSPLPPPWSPRGGGPRGGKPIIIEAKHEKNRKGDVSTSLKINSSPSRPESIEEVFKKQRLYLGYALSRQLYGKKPPFYFVDRLADEDIALTDTLTLTII